jgi:hypothetical protein
MTVKLYLLATDDVDESRDTIFHFPRMPVFRAADDETLACGRCATVIAQNCSTERLYGIFGTAGRQMIVQCDCGAYNVVPS